jgi:hypothetical protein
MKISTFLYRIGHSTHICLTRVRDNGDTEVPLQNNDVPSTHPRCPPWPRARRAAANQRPPLAIWQAIPSASGRPACA